MPYEVRIQRTFCASHQVRLPDGSLEPLHGHNWQVTVTVGSQTLDACGFVVDFHALEQRLDTLLAGLNNRHLNECELLRDKNPSTEIVAHTLATHLPIDPPAKLLSVEVTEAPGCSAVWRVG